MTQPDATITQLQRELEAAFANRADLYRLLYEELTAVMGEAEAEKLLARAIERRGAEAAVAFSGHGPKQALEIGEAFLAASPNGGRMYPTNVLRNAEGITFCVTRCPLKDAWMAAGVNPERLATLCRIAGAFDRGLFEATGVRFSNRTWQPGDGDRCCEISLANSDGHGSDWSPGFA